MSKLEIFVLVFALVLSIAPLGAFVPDQEICDSLYVLGYEGCRVTNRNVWTPRLTGGCGAGDAISAAVATTNPRGNTVSILVCCGYIMKGCTVRTR